MPAPKGNMNAAKNGARMVRLTLGELPKTMRRSTQNARKYRRMLEALVVEAKGEVNSVDAHHIDTAASCEMHCGVCRSLLRNRLKSMTVSDISKCSEQIIKAKTLRDKAIERLRLDVNARDMVIDAMYTAPKGIE